MGNDRIEFYVTEYRGDHEIFCRGTDSKYSEWLWEPYGL